MPSQETSTSYFSLEAAIDRRPLTVSPDASVADAIAMMGKAQGSCTLPTLQLPLNTILMTQARASAVLIVKGSRVLGLFTEREALRAIASGCLLTNLRVTDWMQQPAVMLSQSDTQDVFTALDQLRQHQIHHLPVVTEQRELVGIITPAGIRQALPLDELIKAKQLSDIFSPQVVHLPATASVLDAAQLMSQHQTNCIVLTADVSNSSLVGLLTQCEVLQLHLLGANLSRIAANVVMYKPVLCFSPDKPILAAYWEMQQRCVHRFLVAEGGAGNLNNVLGIVTPTSYLYTLEMEEMRTFTAELQTSIDRFHADPPNAPTNLDEVDKSPAMSSETVDLLQQLQCSRLLADMALRIRESLNLDDILQTAVNEVRQFLQTDRVIIHRFNPDLSGTVVVESVSDQLHPALNSTIQDNCFGQNYAQAYCKGRIQVVADIYTAGLSQCHIDILVLFDVRASLVVPILQGEHLWGLLCAYHCSAPRHWRQYEVDLLKQLATHMAIAIQQSELYEQAQIELVERKRAEEQIKVSLKEKESLLKEVHHRVKNNLQVISSLLRLQSDYVKDERALTLFQESQNRIRSMALIHEKLYQSKDILKIDFAEYILDITTILLRSYTEKAQFIHLDIDANDIWLNIDTAIPCGLIINELVSNILKHAFPKPQDHQQVSIALQASADRSLSLIVSDNGVGFPPDIDFRNTNSLGLQLVCTFVEQLDGTIDLIREQGTTFKIMFAEVDGVRTIQEQ